MPFLFTMQVLATLYPEEVRRKWRPENTAESTAAALVSGAIEFLAMIALLIVRYYSFMTYRPGGLTAALTAKGGAPGNMHSVFGADISVYMTFLLQPITILLIYFTLEGAVRITAVVVTGEVVGTLPFFLLHNATVVLNAYWAERKLGPRIPDRVMPVPSNSEYQLVVASCRPKAHWNSSLTIRYEGSLYEVYQTGKGKAPRPYLYYLRLAPLSKTVRGLYDYDPMEPLDGGK